MSTPVIALLSQLKWWLRLPPTNLIERHDVLRFRNALYLMIHQIAGVLLEVNGKPVELTFPSTMERVHERIRGLPRVPENTAARLEWVIGADRNIVAWNAASDLLKEVLAVDGNQLPVDRLQPGTLTNSVASLEHTAERVSLVYAGLTGVDAVALSGSMAHGLADRRSDVDISVFCEVEPPVSERLKLMRIAGATDDMAADPACDTFWIDGVLVHVRYWLSGDARRLVSRLDRVPESPFLAEELQTCTALHDEAGTLVGWKVCLSSFSVELVSSIVDASRVRVAEFRSLYATASARGDILHAYCLANQSVNDWLLALFAQNQQFLSSPRWIRQRVSDLEWAPDDCTERLLKVVGPMDGPDIDRWEILEDLWRELPSLVAS